MAFSRTWISYFYGELCVLNLVRSLSIILFILMKKSHSSLKTHRLTLNDVFQNMITFTFYKQSYKTLLKLGKPAMILDHMPLQEKKRKVILTCRSVKVKVQAKVTLTFHTTLSQKNTVTFSHSVSSLMSVSNFQSASIDRLYAASADASYFSSHCLASSPAVI